VAVQAAQAHKMVALVLDMEMVAVGRQKMGPQAPRDPVVVVVVVL
jgi:hypothetical protein